MPKKDVKDNLTMGRTMSGQLAIWRWDGSKSNPTNVTMQIVKPKARQVDFKQVFFFTFRSTGDKFIENSYVAIEHVHKVCATAKAISIYGENCIDKCYHSTESLPDGLTLRASHRRA